MLSLVAAMPRQLVAVDSLSDRELGGVAAKDFLGSVIAKVANDGCLMIKRRLRAGPLTQNGIVSITRSNWLKRRPKRHFAQGGAAFIFRLLSRVRWNFGQSQITR